ncbi:MAG: DUF1508 domain-containing protein [Verrucomicrobiales bacterium]|nr:DUF1508 domain-containing protein [Verrucomicrobiales bacterium]
MSQQLDELNRLLDEGIPDRPLLVKVYLDLNGEYRWRIKAPNGKILCVSSESYHNRIDCEKALRMIKSKKWRRDP